MGGHAMGPAAWRAARFRPEAGKRSEAMDGERVHDRYSSSASRSISTSGSMPVSA